MGKRGRTPKTYTRERAELVRDRVRQGERITDVYTDMDMDFSNFCRWCRRNNFVVHTEASRAAARSLPRKPYPIGQIPERLRQPRPGGRAEKIVLDLKSGLTPTDIASRHGVTYTYVVRVRKLVGLAPPAGPGRNIPRKDRHRPHAKRNAQI